MIMSLLIEVMSWNLLKGQWVYRSKFSWPWHQLKISGQFYVLVALLQGKMPR
jgi:hypothetical protein